MSLSDVVNTIPDFDSFIFSFSMTILSKSGVIGICILYLFQSISNTQNKINVLYFYIQNLEIIITYSQISLAVLLLLMIFYYKDHEAGHLVVCYHGGILGTHHTLSEEVMKKFFSSQLLLCLYLLFDRVYVFTRIIYFFFFIFVTIYISFEQ